MDVKEQRQEYLKVLETWFNSYTSRFNIDNESTMKIQSYFKASRYYNNSYARFCGIETFKNDMVNLGCTWIDCSCGTLGKLTYTR